MPDESARQIPIERTRALRQSILRPHESVEQLAGEEPRDAYAVGAFDREELLAVGFVAPDGPPGSWRVRAMATAAGARGRGFGGAVLGALVDHAREHGGVRVWCNARSPARAFYERAGFHATSEEFEIPPIGPHFVMERSLS
ncbi:MAG TPA: GNAT family N-acetyltransferase [Solirubrobacteraceae bacterium]|nr:GNAT family N-acetyltransferase [Solirubrobacteraceae bacterium]